MAVRITSSPYSMGNSVPYMGNSVPYMGNSVPYMGNSVPYMGNSVPYMGNSVPYMGNSVPYMGNSVPYMGNSVPYMGNSVPYMGNSVPYMGGAEPPKLGVSKRADLASLKKFSGNLKFTGFDEDLAKAFWTLQALAVWLTDGGGFEEQFPTQIGLISKAPRGPFNPADPSPILNPDGSVKDNLIEFVNPKGNNDITYLLGPDAKYGNALESLLVDYAGTRKILGKNPPEASKRWLELAVARSRAAVPQVAAADDAFKAGNVAASRTSAASTPCSQLHDAAAAAAGCPPRTQTASGSGSTTPTRTPAKSPSRTPAKSPSRTPTSTATAKPASGGRKVAESGTAAKKGDVAEAEEDNTLLYVGLGLLGVAVVAGGVYYAQQQKKKKKSSAVQKVKDASMTPGGMPSAADTTAAASSNA